MSSVPEAPEKVDHNYTYLARFDGDSYLLTARIRLFAAVGGPWAEVVVGRTSRERIAARKPYAIDFEEKEFDPQTGAVLRLIRSPAEP